MVNINIEIDKLIDFALDKNMISKWDIELSRNEILDLLDLDSYEEATYEKEISESPVEILERISEWAVENKRVEDGIIYRDILDSKIMAILMPKQGEIIKEFYDNYKESPQKATDRYYNLSKYSNYIMTKRVAKDIKWESETEYGTLEITINLSKPEKDPKSIEAEKHAVTSNYPKCLLCVENVGYRGRVNHPARKNHRIIPVELGGKQWYLQYSPYVYYNEHAIVLSKSHEPMKISKESFEKLLEFIEIFPHYFVGSNADLPIVGGSILSHDHFQGGNYEFPMAKAPIEYEFQLENYKGIKAGLVNWPMSVIRLNGSDRKELLEAASHILDLWRGYSDESAEIYAFSEGTPHNTITPIARRRGENYEIDLVLRNNRRNDKHPMGIFHPYKEYHNIKKENIGLIEVMGLAVLPGRLKEELNILKEYLTKDNALELIEADEKVRKHHEWIEGVISNLSGNTEEFLRKEVGKVFSKVLECAGVYKRDEDGQKAFRRFIEKI